MACEKCFRVPPSLDDFELVRELFSSSHLDYMLLRCYQCQQVFLQSFDEEIDWEGGNDRMWSIYLALTEAEVDSINALSDNECAQGLHNETLHRIRESNPSIVKGPDNQWKANCCNFPGRHEANGRRQWKTWSNLRNDLPLVGHLQINANRFNSRFRALLSDSPLKPHDGRRADRIGTAVEINYAAIQYIQYRRPIFTKISAAFGRS
jgi:hypothetical protein